MTRNSAISSRAEGGFTLIEVLIALTIAGIALASVIKITGQYAANLATVQERTWGHWIAMNRIVETQVTQKWPDTELTRGESKFNDVPVYWRSSVFDTNFERIRRLEVQVFRHENDAEFITRLNSYIGRESSW